MANPTNVLSSGIEIIGSIRFSNDMIHRRQDRG
jgi:hypothetical protein